MRENELTLIGKSVFTLLILLITFSALQHIWQREVHSPSAFVLTLVGFAFFASAKLSVIRKGHWINFGTQRMTENMANLYRLGYWLMIVGVLCTCM